jgi:50S ribosomal protein L16 3-hydroxylase
MAQRLLGGLPVRTFLRRYWQRRALFVRGALAPPDCSAWLTRETLFALAGRDDVESRIVARDRGRWTVEHGPFSQRKLARMPARDWTLLVQGVEQHLPEAARLLRHFSFIPHARLDDLMVSYAAPGGGVGPHFDSYDVFLLQGAGTRRWRVSAQKNLALVDDVPLRILKHMRATREWEAAPGDLLYLPPRYAHDGVALSPCITLSVGFRLPGRQELASGFLDFLQDELNLDGMLEDRGLPWQRHPARLPDFLVQKFARVISRVRWTNDDVRRFAGCWMSTPKPQVVFRRPRVAMPLARFTARLTNNGARLALPTRMLYAGGTIFINGECHTIDRRDAPALTRLADTRETPAFAPRASTARLLHGWYCAGYLRV